MTSDDLKAIKERWQYAPGTPLHGCFDDKHPRPDFREGFRTICELIEAVAETNRRAAEAEAERERLQIRLLAAANAFQCFVDDVSGLVTRKYKEASEMVRDAKS